MIQLRALIDCETIWTPRLRRGEPVWVKDMKAARHLIENGICEYIAPLIEKAVEPVATKEPAPVKYSAGQKPGRSTGLRSSSASGPAKPWSAWGAALVSPLRI